MMAVLRPKPNKRRLEMKNTRKLFENADDLLNDRINEMEHMESLVGAEKMSQRQRNRYYKLWSDLGDASFMSILVYGHGVNEKHMEDLDHDFNLLVKETKALSRRVLFMTYCLMDINKRRCEDCKKVCCNRLAPYLG
jgi:hypothetical protein